MCRGRKSCLQTRKMRVEIQFYELKIWVLEKSCEFNNLPVANTVRGVTYISYLRNVTCRSY